MKNQELSGKRVLNGTLQGLASAVLKFAVSMALARAMDFEAYGEYSAAMGVLLITAVIASIGMGRVATKVYRDASTEENHLKARGLRMAGPVLIVIVSAITYAALVGSHALIHDKTAVRLASFAAVLSLLPIVCLRRFFRASGAAHGSAVTANALNGWIARCLFLLLLGAAIYIWGHPMALLAVAATRATSATLILFAIWFLVLRVEPGYLHIGKRRYEVRSWVKAGITFSLTSLGLTIIDNAGVVVLGWVNANAGAAARLAAASALGTVMLTTAMNVRNIFSPVLVEVILKRDPLALRRIFRIWFLRMSMLVVPMAA
ncbi:MAG: oligosaccharide flippase family protein, partial [Myxococcota bacterium]|nr:oligosaccharide flippase family protein [Myxococcota bacterium]